MLARFRVHRPITAAVTLFRNMSSKSADEQRQEAAAGAIEKTGAQGDDPKKVTEEQWRKALPSGVYHVTREAGTEPPFSGQYDKLMKDGMYHCICCGVQLFSSDDKFNSGCGWPAFHTAVNESTDDTSNVVRITDNSMGTTRVEVRCKKCNAHLGHVFNDGPKPTGERYCINSVCMAFAPADKK